MQVIQKQESILRYDMFFSDNNTRCTVLEEFATPEGVFEHVKANADLLEQLTQLGGKIEGKNAIAIRVTVCSRRRAGCSLHGIQDAIIIII